jgi:hypothetical protein
VRITRALNPVDFEEFDVRRLRVGEVFDLAPRLASLLIVAGNAEPVFGSAIRAEAADAPPARSKDPSKGPKKG